MTKTTNQLFALAAAIVTSIAAHSAALTMFAAQAANFA